MDRRRFVKATGLGVAGWAVGCTSDPVRDPKPSDAGSPAIDSGPVRIDAGEPLSDVGQGPRDAGQAGCSVTGADIEGPYYRPGVPIRSNLDLYSEVGDPLVLQGTVTDEECTPLSQAVVEIWHANPAGDYDTRSADKRYYGQVATNAAGVYSFSTLMPGRYLNGATYRPAHIHMKVFVAGVERLTTQIYFDGDPYSAADPFFEADRSVPVQAGIADFSITV